eukprot:1160908-Pyramimonas_sp.AAC.1
MQGPPGPNPIGKPLEELAKLAKGWGDAPPLETLRFSGQCGVKVTRIASSTIAMINRFNFLTPLVRESCATSR